MSDWVRRLGKSSVDVTRVGVGCGNFGRSVRGSRVNAIVSAALDAGVTFFDTADVYGDPHGYAEQSLGQALEGRRNRVVIATKCGFSMEPGPALAVPTGHGTRRYLTKSLEGSLRRLSTDYVDLFQMHVPDQDTPIEETLSAFEDLIRLGKARAVGVSRYSKRELIEAARSSSPISSVQIEYSLLSHAAEDLLPTAVRAGLGVLACLPLASGLLSGKYSRLCTAPRGSRLDVREFAFWYDGVPWAKIEAIRDFAGRNGVSMTAVALGYLLSRPAVTSVIVGVSSEAQVIENVAACQWRPDAAATRALDTIVHSAPSFGARVPWEMVGRW